MRTRGVGVKYPKCADILYGIPIPLKCTSIIPQIRAHMGLGLGCPIVGDHKYEHAAEIGPPQKLPGACLNRLGIRQAQVRGNTEGVFCPLRLI